MSEAGQPSTGAAQATKVIKRYTNRKLYDTVESRYVTLDEIAQMIKGGLEVQIVDNRTKDDLTSVTLAQIIFEEEKKKSKMPLGILRDIIQHGGEALSGFLQQQVGQRMASIREEAEVLRDRLLRREDDKGQPAPEAAAEPPPAAAPLSQKRRAVEQAKDLLAQSQRVLDEWQRHLDERVRHTLESITSLPLLAKDMATLEKRIGELEKKLEEMEREGTAEGDGTSAAAAPQRPTEPVEPS